VSGSGLWVGWSSSTEDKSSVAAFAARPGDAAAALAGVSKVDGVEPTATEMFTDCQSTMVKNTIYDNPIKVLL